LSPPALQAAFQASVGEGPSRFSLSAEIELEDGILVLFGASGTGKSLTLAALAGHVRPTEGRIEICGRTVFEASTSTWVAPRQRRVALVPQHHSLFPFLDVEGNVSFGLPRRRRRKGDSVVRLVMEEMGVAHLANASPGTLSGGERQRVALARALAVEPEILLLDEPFAAIDMGGRAALREVLREAVHQRGISAVFVTHSKEEAMSLADRVTLFRRGATGRSGSPDDIFGAAGAMTIKGRVLQSQPSEGAGRVRLSLAEPTVDGPADLLVPDDDGLLEITVQRLGESDE